MVEIGPTYFQKPCLRILGYISVVDYFFFLGCSSVFLFLASSPYTMYQKYKPLDKRLRQFFRQTGKEANKILIELFSLYAKLQHMHHVAACVKQFYSCFFFSRSQICCNLEIQGRNYETTRALNMNILVLFYS